ncbi:LysR substrate-binding domain-containing protein [Paenalcaligenes sp. Me52]|uniref:LysR substrate-binding domain-containing protein n=1 Tax=Paenalcaligenes sp. Me52 TaxID=3392038 RepID=UPI003D29FB9C
MMDVKPLRYFVMLAETLHFGQAAARLHISQPPLSRQLAALEQSIGVKLIERNSRNVTLTVAGERFYQDAKNVLNTLEQAVHNARAVAAGEAGVLTIGFTMCAAYSVIPRYTRLFSAAWPDVTLQLREVVSNNLLEQVRRGDIDAAVLLPSEDEQGLNTQTVVAESLCVALASTHALASESSLAITQLQNEAFVVAAESAASSLYAAIVTHCQKNGFNPNIRFEVQLQQTVLSLVAEGVGIALVPASMQKAQVAGVRYLPLDNAPLIEQVLAWSPTNQNPCLRGFLECVGS